jgi:hypothetical protein
MPYTFKACQNKKTGSTNEKGRAGQKRRDEEHFL